MHVHLLNAGSTLRDGTPLVEETIVPLDGDLSKVVHRYVKDATFDHGRPIRTEHVPTIWSRAPSRNPIRDVMRAEKSALFVGPRLRDLTEGLEPSVHQFLPASLTTGGETVAEMSYFVVCTRLDALDPTACVPPIEPGARRFQGVRRPGDKLVFDARKVAGHHVFHDLRSVGRFISQELRDAIEASGIEGVDFGTPIQMSHI